MEQQGGKLVVLAVARILEEPVFASSLAVVVNQEHMMIGNFSLELV